MSAAKFTLYTNHRCPWAHRAHIALTELGIPFEEVIIDLDRPRDPWYLEINPRGLVPALKYNDEIITESAIVSQFLVDAFPDKALLPLPGTLEGALGRARIAFFVDTYMSKLQSHLYKLGTAKTEQEQNAVAEAFTAAAVKEVEPLLAGSTSATEPFFGGSKKLTFAEVLTGSFAIRLFTLSKAGVYPRSIATSLEAQAPALWAWIQKVAAHPSITNIYNEDEIIKTTKARLAKQRA